MLPQNNNQPPHKISETTKKKLLGGTRKQARKIKQLGKVENKAGPAKSTVVVSSIRSHGVPSHYNSKEKAASSAIGGAIVHNLSQTHDNGDGMTFTSIPNAHALEARDFDSSPLFPNHSQAYDNGDGEGASAFVLNSQAHDGRTSSDQTYDNGDGEGASAFVLNSQTHDERSSSDPPFPNNHGKITSILNPQTYDNGESPQTNGEGASAFVFNSQTHNGSPSSDPPFPNHYENIWNPQTYDNGEGPQSHNGRDILYPQAYSGKASSSPTLSRYYSNYYARISSILNNPQDLHDPCKTLPPFPWVLNNLINNNNNDLDDVSLPPIHNNSTH